MHYNRMTMQFRLASSILFNKLQPRVGANIADPERERQGWLEYSVAAAARSHSLFVRVLVPLSLLFVRFLMPPERTRAQTRELFVPGAPSVP